MLIGRPMDIRMCQKGENAEGWGDNLYIHRVNSFQFRLIFICNLANIYSLIDEFP